MSAMMDFKEENGQYPTKMTSLSQFVNWLTFNLSKIYLLLSRHGLVNIILGAFPK